MPRVVHTDPRSFDDGERFGLRCCGDEEVVTDEVMAVKTPVNVHRAAEQAGAAGPVVEVFDRFQCPQQDGGSMAFALRHHIHTVIPAIDEIDVGMPRGTEHYFGPFRQTAR